MPERLGHHNCLLTCAHLCSLVAATVAVGIVCVFEVMFAAKHRRVDKEALFLPLDRAAATAAAQQWRGIGLDQSKGNFKVWYLREYVGSRWTLEDAIALMIHTIQQREQRVCERASLWVRAFAALPHQ